MTKNISDIFLPVMASDESFVDLHILIEGAPGIGKTVLAKEIAYQWAKNELLASKKLLLLVFLRECYQRSMMSIENLIQFVIKNSEVTSCVTKYLTETEGKDTVIIFDGFDELSEENRKRSIIVDIINHRILSKCCLVVTSRPTASSSLRGSVDRRVEIVGFTEEDRLDYIKTALEDHDEQVKALQHYLLSNPTINALCYIPLNMTILLSLVEDGLDRLPRTQTEMYKRFIETTIIRYIKKYEHCDTIINIAKLPHPYYELLTELTKLAYKALKTDKTVFTLSEINKDCPYLTMTSNNWNGLGLLKAVQCFNKEIGNDQVTFHFLHFSIKEYMAAWYISTLSDSKQIELLQKTFWEHRYYNTWIMYIGITHGSSFALTHFLSGNKLQFYSKLFKSSEVSKKILKHKMKCLHLFQCLVEADKVDSMKQLDFLVKEVYENNQIDLSNQTLLPSDLNTLGFFLIKSINKEWDDLNLSNCSIGSNGSNVLCDKLLDKHGRCIVTIKTVNFSYNQLNFSSLIRLFDLFNSWHTSEIIITDDVSLDKTIDSKKMEDTVLQSSTLALVLVISCLFCKNVEFSKVHHILSNTTNIRSVYLLNCTWILNDSDISKLSALFRKQQLYKIRIISSPLNTSFISTLVLMLLNNDSANMFVYDPTMSDQTADDISSLITSSNKDISGVMLIISSSKVQGIVNTCSLSKELSTLEIFNLSRYIRYLNTEMCPWSLESNSQYTDVIFTFIKLLHKIDFDWKLKVLLWENNTLIVHNSKFKSFDKFKQFTNNNIYLSSCDVSEPQYDVISGTCSTLHILNSPECVEMLHAKLSHKQFVPKEMFVYGNIEYDLMNSLIELLSHDHLNISAVLAANGVIVGIDPSSDLIALAFQLQPLPIAAAISCNTKLQEIDISENYLLTAGVQKSMKALQGINTLRKLCLSNNNITGKAVDDIAAVVSCNTSLQEIDVSGNNLQTIGATKIARALGKMYALEKLNFSNNNITGEAADDIAAAISYTKLQEIDISENYLLTAGVQKIMKALQGINTLRKLCLSNSNITGDAADDIAAVVSFNKSLQEIDISGNDLQTEGIIKIATALQQTYGVTKLCLSNNNITDIAGDDIAKVISHNMHLQEFHISGNKLSTIGAIKIAKALRSVFSLKALCISDNEIDSRATHDIATAISHANQLHKLDISKNNFKIRDIEIILKQLQYCDELTKLYINDNNMTDDKIAHDVGTVISFNSKLQEIDISGSNLQARGAINVAAALQSIVMLTKLCISNNNITHHAANDIAIAITCNVHLQHLSIGGNDLLAAGATIIAKSLQKISTLTKLYINNNKITSAAADDIAAAVSCNPHLEEFDISENEIEGRGAIKLAKSFQKNSLLKKLFVDHNRITDEAADDFASVISHNPHLIAFKINGNLLQNVKIIKAAFYASKNLTEIDI